MVARLYLLFLWMPLFLFSGEFTASINRSEVSLSEGFTLTLTLKDASAKTSPSIEPLTNDFHVNSQQQFSNTSFINGKVTASTSWKYILIPFSEGEIIIPSLSLMTSEGVLSSAPLKIQAVKSLAPTTAAPISDDVVISTQLSNENPYKNEPIFLTIRLTSQQMMANIQAQKLHVEDAIVEIESQPKVYEKIVDGARVKVIEFGYLITPLKAGTLKIPSHVVQGSGTVKWKHNTRSFFDNDFDPFFMMQGFDQLKPFSLATGDTVLNVLPPHPDVNPWLPAKSLRIEEVWDDTQPLQVGEFFTRGFKIDAEGISSTQLPNLNDQQVGNNKFKIYADKPELKDETKEGRVISSRKEQYTIIPQQAGTLTLPEISVSWWDVSKNQKVTRVIPSRTLNVIPAQEGSQKTPVTDVAESKIEPAIISDASINPLLYGIISVLAGFLLLVLIWGILLQKRVNRLLSPLDGAKPVKPAKVVPVQVKSSFDPFAVAPKSKKEKLNDLNPT